MQQRLFWQPLWELDLINVWPRGYINSTVMFLQGLGSNKRYKTIRTKDWSRLTFSYGAKEEQQCTGCCVKPSHPKLHFSVSSVSFVITFKWAPNGLIEEVIERHRLADVNQESDSFINPRSKNEKSLKFSLSNALSVFRAKGPAEDQVSECVPQFVEGFLLKRKKSGLVWMSELNS